MRKVVVHRPGGLERLKIEEHPSPAYNEDEILVSVGASGINFADISVRMGIYKSALVYVGFPITPGFEFAGTVKAVGDKVTSFKVGDKVYGFTRFGAYASEVVIPENQLFHRPDFLSEEQAAGIPAVFLTAYHALFHNFVLRKGSKVLVHSAAGGVGTTLCQMLRMQDCYVVGVVGRSHKKDMPIQHGADVVIDKSSEDLWARAKELVPEGFDAILDCNGLSVQKQGMKHLAPVGKMVVFGYNNVFSKKGSILSYLKILVNLIRFPRYNPAWLLNQNKSIICFNVSFLFDRKDLIKDAMDQITLWLNEKKIQPPKLTVYPIEDVKKAHAAISSGETTGKLILKW